MNKFKTEYDDISPNLTDVYIRFELTGFKLSKK